MTASLKALMLGWEFPPHISGGLGTACLGLATGLAQHDVEITFVVPVAHGDEEKGFGDVVGADSVKLPRKAMARADHWTGLREELAEGLSDGVQETPDASAGERVGDDASSAENLAALARSLRVLEVDSPLAPYLTPAEYLRRVSPHGGEVSGAPADEPAVLPGRIGTDPSTHGAEHEHDAGSPTTAETTEADEGTLSFHGHYGEDLFAEVARYARVVEALAGRETFDVVHAHDWMTYPAGIGASRASGKPLVVHLHASEYDRSGEGVNEAVRDIEHLGLAAADRVICVSHFLASIVRRRYGIDASKIRVVHNAVTHREQQKQFHWKKAIDVPVVLFLGRVTHQKGPGYFLEAAARVIRIEPNVKFVISGSGDMLPGVIDQAAELGLARHVHFTGFLRGTDVERMYAMADIYVMPSVSEPFGIAPLEAMAADVPVIVSKQSGVSEIVSNALKVDFWDVDDIANKILALLTHRELVRQMIEEGGEEVRRQRWEYRGGMVRDIYEEVVS